MITPGVTSTRYSRLNFFFLVALVNSWKSFSQHMGNIIPNLYIWSANYPTWKINKNRFIKEAGHLFVGGDAISWMSQVGKEMGILLPYIWPAQPPKDPCTYWHIGVWYLARREQPSQMKRRCSNALASGCWLSRCCGTCSLKITRLYPAAGQCRFLPQPTGVCLFFYLKNFSF